MFDDDDDGDDDKHDIWSYCCKHSQVLSDTRITKDRPYRSIVEKLKITNNDQSHNSYKEHKILRVGQTWISEHTRDVTRCLAEISIPC